MGSLYSQGGIMNTYKRILADTKLKDPGSVKRLCAQLYAEFKRNKSKAVLSMAQQLQNKPGLDVKSASIVGYLIYLIEKESK